MSKYTKKEIATVTLYREKNNEAVIHFENTDVEEINKLRIWFIRDLPIYSIEKVIIENNTGAFIDEHMCKALGDVPIANDISENLCLQLLIPFDESEIKHNNRDYDIFLEKNFNDDDSDENCFVISNKDLEVSESSDIKNIKTMLKKSQTKTIILNILKKDQHVKAYCFLERGIPKIHNKWSGVAGASYKQLKKNNFDFYLFGNDSVEISTLLWLLQWHLNDELKFSENINIKFKQNIPWTIKVDKNEPIYTVSIFRENYSKKQKLLTTIQKFENFTIKSKVNFKQVNIKEEEIESSEQESSEEEIESFSSEQSSEETSEQESSEETSKQNSEESDESFSEQNSEESDESFSEQSSEEEMEKPDKVKIHKKVRTAQKVKDSIIDEEEIQVEQEEYQNVERDNNEGLDIDEFDTDNSPILISEDEKLYEHDLSSNDENEL